MTGKEEKRNIKTYAALVFVLVFLFALTLMYLVNQEQEQEEKLKATYMAEATVSRVEAQLSQYLTKADVLKNLVEDGHELNDEQFKVLAQVMQDDTHIIEASTPLQVHLNSDREEWVSFCLIRSIPQTNRESSLSGDFL